MCCRQRRANELCPGSLFASGVVDIDVAEDGVDVNDDLPRAVLKAVGYVCRALQKAVVGFSENLRVSEHMRGPNFNPKGLGNKDFDVAEEGVRVNMGNGLVAASLGEIEAHVSEDGPYGPVCNVTRLRSREPVVREETYVALAGLRDSAVSGPDDQKADNDEKQRPNRRPELFKGEIDPPDAPGSKKHACHQGQPGTRTCASASPLEQLARTGPDQNGADGCKKG